MPITKIEYEKCIRKRTWTYTSHVSYHLTVARRLQIVHVYFAPVSSAPIATKIHPPAAVRAIGLVECSVEHVSQRQNGKGQCTQPARHQSASNTKLLCDNASSLSTISQSWRDHGVCGTITARFSPRIFYVSFLSRCTSTTQV